MNDLLKELEATKISGDFSEVELWSACTDLIRKSYVPEKTIGASRPCEEKDFREYRQIVDRNLRNIRSMFHHTVHTCNKRVSEINLNASAVRTCTINLVLLIGEHHERNLWNTAESVSISKELLSNILELHRCETTAEFFMEEDNFIAALLTLRPKLMKETWKAYPAAVACYKWLLYQTEKPALYSHIDDVLPTALIIVDDYVPDNVVIGLQCLLPIIQHSHLKKRLIDTGYAKVIFDALEPLAHQREAKYVIPLYLCITSLLPTMEHWDDTSCAFDWTKRDDVLTILLGSMEFEQNVELRRVYMLSLPQLLTHIGCTKWSNRLTRILTEYCEHHTDLQTLKATLESAKRFLLMFHLRVTAHCVPLYTAFLKLHFDLTKTPVFDKEIMENLEDCICLLYKLSPNVGCAVMKNDRMRSVIENSLQVIYVVDTKYFE